MSLEKNITKRKTPFYSSLKSLLNERIFEMTYFSGHVHFLKVSYETHFFFNVEPLVCIYIARKIHQNNPLLTAFSVLIQRICRAINAFQQAHSGFFPLAIFSIRTQQCKQKTVLRVQMNELK